MARLYDWLNDPQRNEKIYNSRLNDEFNNLATRNFIPSLDYAVGDNAADDTVAMQAWIDACIAQDKPGFLEEGYYRITSPLSITDTITIIGVNREISNIRLDSTTVNAFSVNTDKPVYFSNFGIRGSTSAAGGSLVHVTSPVAQWNFYSQFHNMYFIGGFEGLRFAEAAGWTASGCYFQAQVSAGIDIANDTTPDAGDQCIHDCTFSQAAGNIGILQRSAGGLRITSCKIGGGGGYGYRLLLDAGVSTSELFIAGCSFEGMTGACIDFVKQSGTSFGSVQITGNQLGGNICINQGDTNAGFMIGLEITGNTMAVTGASQAAVRIFGTTMLTIVGNTFWGTGGTNTAMSIGANAATGMIGLNTFYNITTPISNSSTTVKHLDYQEGTWTPVLTFATPGDLAVTYTTQTGTWTKIGRQVTLTCRIHTSAFTHTTAAGALTITGLPFTAGGAEASQGQLSFQGITIAGYTQLSSVVTPSAATMTFTASGTGVGAAVVAASHMPTGGTVVLTPTAVYFT